jgi:ketosteroid isomerase-like protein
MPRSARDAAETYRAAVNTKDLGLLRTIFADDVTLLVPINLTPDDPTGRYRGVDAVMEFFGHVSFPVGAILTYTHVYEDGSSCVVELEAEAGHYHMEAVDIFTVNDQGLVGRMAVYARVY